MVKRWRFKKEIKVELVILPKAGMTKELSCARFMTIDDKFKNS